MNALIRELELALKVENLNEHKKDEFGRKIQKAYLDRLSLLDKTKNLIDDGTDCDYTMGRLEATKEKLKDQLFTLEMYQKDFPPPTYDFLPLPLSFKDIRILHKRSQRAKK